MIRRTAVLLRRLAWLDFTLAGAMLVLVVGAAHGASHSTLPRGSISSTAVVPTPIQLGMVMPPAPAAGTASETSGNQVTIENFSFGPATLTVSAGATVTWTNSDSVTHTVTAADARFDSSNLRPGDQFSYTFSAPGTYSYHCSIHPFMTGQVVVQ
jgi:plastocyanin